MNLPKCEFYLGTRRETVYVVNGERWRAVTGEFAHGGGGPGSYLWPWIGTVHHDNGKADSFPPEEVVRAVSRAVGVFLVGARFRRTGPDTSVVEYSGQPPETAVQVHSDLWELPSYAARYVAEKAATATALAAVDSDSGAAAGRNVVADVRAAMLRWTEARWPDAPWMWATLNADVESALPF